MSSSADPENDTTTNNMIHDKDARITSLSNQKAAQNEMIEGLQRELGEAEIRHKEEVYWLRLELDNLGREKESIEDRVAEMYRDLSGFEQPETSTALEAEIANMTPLEMKETLTKYARTITILENQTSMVKQSCDEVVKSLKLEISDVMEDKTRMEMDLLNQLAVLDNDKREIEMDFEEQLKYKNEKIAELKEGIGVVRTSGTSSSSKSQRKEEEWLTEISDLKSAKKKLEDDFLNDRHDLEDQVARLEEANADLDQQIESMTCDLDVMRQGAAAEAIQVLDALTRDRQETLTTLERVAMIWEKADDSIQGLEDVMDELRPSDDDNVQGDRERLLSTLETASLVHGQIKVSLLLVELKLRNQLSSLKNDKLRMGAGAAGGGSGSGALVASDHNLTERMKEIQQEALTALTQVEDSLTDQIKQLENLTREETTQVRDDLQDKTDELRALQGQQKKLESEVSRLRKQEEQYKANGGGKNGSKTSSDNNNNNAPGSADTAISKQVLERLQNEVLTVVERVRDKNDTIARLQTTIEEHKVRESALKRELKRMMRSSRSSSNKADGEGGGSGGRAGRRGSAIRS